MVDFSSVDFSSDVFQPISCELQSQWLQFLEYVIKSNWPKVTVTEWLVITQEMYKD